MRTTRILLLGSLVLTGVVAPIRAEGEMKRLSKARQAKARDFIMTQARPLEQALYRFEFEGGSREAVLNALKPYQNPDGGFGRALEPDLRAPESSVVATLQALHIFSTLKTPTEQAMVRETLAYLSASYDDATAVWRIIPPTTDAHPHAPWWDQATLNEAFRGFRLIPRAEVLGYLYAFDARSFPPDRRLVVAREVVRDLESTADSDVGMAVEGCARLYEGRALPPEIKGRLHARLVKLIPGAVEQDPAKWKQYCLKPLWLVRTPESPFARLLTDSVERNLDYEVEGQSADGSWGPNWTWYGKYPETWPIAEGEWRGVLTVRTLETLRAFGRMEP